MAATPVILPDGCVIAPAVRAPATPCETRSDFGLYSVAPPLPMPDHGEAGGVEWEPEVCEPSAETYCNTCTRPGDERVWHGPPDLRTAAPFTVYGSFKCSGPGYSPAEMQRRARQNLELGEEWQVESEFSISLQNDPDLIDLTPLGGAVSFTAGLVALETYARKQLLCLPTLHLRGGLALAAPLGALVYGESTIRTALGSHVTAPAGWDTRGPGGVVPADNEHWLWVTGPVRIWRSDIIEPTADGVVNRDNNDLRALAERNVLLGHECGAAAIRVSLP